MSRYIVLAPHVDDEMIGCWTPINDRLIDVVVYFFDLTPSRKEESMRAGVEFDFVPSYKGFEFEFRSDDIIYAPNIADEHPEHKLVNHFAKTLPNKKLYYSVDMNVKKYVLEDVERQAKLRALNRCYPSQSKLFLSNDKYHLFESLMNDDSSKMIWVTFQCEGIHCYPAALTDPNLVDVKFLGYEHRHQFHFRVSIEVFHNDRDLEFIQFQRWLKSLYSGTLELNHQSCEMLADALYLEIARKYPARKVKIEVSEDNENGCEVNYG